MSASGEEPWLFAIGSNDEDVVRTLRLRTRPPEPAERAAMPLLVMARWAFESDVAHMPEDEDLDAMAIFENALDADMEREGWGLLAAVVTSQGVREWRLYTDDFERFQQGFNDALLGLQPFPLSFELFEDPDWYGHADLAESIDYGAAGEAQAN